MVIAGFISWLSLNNTFLSFIADNLASLSTFSSHPTPNSLYYGVYAQDNLDNLSSFVLLSRSIPKKSAISFMLSIKLAPALIKLLDPL